MESGEVVAENVTEVQRGREEVQVGREGVLEGGEGEQEGEEDPPYCWRCGREFMSWQSVTIHLNTCPNNT